MLRFVDDVGDLVPVRAGSRVELPEGSAYGQGYAVAELPGICAEFGVVVEGVITRAGLVGALRGRGVAVPPKRPGRG
jgi:hypothetical protein